MLDSVTLVSRQVDSATGQDLSQNRQPELRNIDITIVVLATVFVGLRFFSRWKAGVHYGVDDYTLLLALVRRMSSSLGAADEDRRAFSSV